VELTGDARSGEVAALVLNAGVVPRDGGSDGVADEKRKVTTSSKSCSAMTCASRGDVERRLELHSGLVVFGLLDLLRVKVKQRHQSTCQRERRRRMGSRGERGASPRQNRRCLAAEGSDSGDEIQQPGGSKSRRGRKGKERRARGSYRRGLDGHLLARK
jgi:hypothetical protein